MTKIRDSPDRPHHASVCRDPSTPTRVPAVDGVAMAVVNAEVNPGRPTQARGAGAPGAFTSASGAEPPANAAVGPATT
jgi:hypothetical protein